MTDLQRHSLRKLVELTASIGPVEERLWKSRSGANVRTIDALERDGLVEWAAVVVKRSPRVVQRFYKPTTAGLEANR